MAENGEVPEEEKKPVDEDAKEKEPIETAEDLVESQIEPEEKKRDEEEGKDKDEAKEERKDKADLVEHEIEPEEKKKDEEREVKDKDEEERKDKAENEEEHKDKDEDEKDKIDKDDEDKYQDKIEDESDLIKEPVLDSTLVDVAKGTSKIQYCVQNENQYSYNTKWLQVCKITDEPLNFAELAESIISSPFLTDDIITKLKAMDERCIVLVDEIQQLKREVQELSEVLFYFI